MADDLARLRAALIDGRCRAPFYRQTELESLHHALLSNVGALKDALVQDCNYTEDETTWELSSSLLCVKQEYENFHPQEELDKEYRIAHNKDNADHREPVGICYIEPAKHTPLYSIISALAPSIGAGNCNLLLLSEKTTLGRVLRSALSTLDHDSLVIMHSPIQQSIAPGRTLHILQSSSEPRPRSDELVSLDRAISVAVVDRTADMKIAAQHLATARMAFGGRSPYAPDVVFVNEWIMGDFVQALLRAAMPATSRRAGLMATIATYLDSHVASIQKLDSGTQILMRTDNLVILQRGSSNDLLVKTECPLLILHPIRSLDHAMDLISAQQSGSPALATYLFANSETAKYLSQFIESAASFVNHIPSSLLLGPAFPHTKHVQLGFRYSRELLTVPRPQYSSPASHAASAATSGRLSSQIATLRTKALSPLNVPPRHNGSGIGFFERGALGSVAVFLSTIIGTGVFAAVCLYRSRAA